MRTKPQKSIQLTARTAGVTLKPVVAIVMPAATPCQHTGRQVCRNEDRPPLLRLPHVGLFMIAKQFKTERIATEYHMSQRHRVEADTVGEPPGKPAVKLKGPAPVLNPSARPQRERSGNQPHQGGRRRPGVTRQSGQRPGHDRPGQPAPCVFNAARPRTVWSLVSPIPIAPHAMIQPRERGKICRPDRYPPRFGLPAQPGTARVMQSGRADQVAGWRASTSRERQLPTNRPPRRRSATLRPCRPERAAAGAYELGLDDRTGLCRRVYMDSYSRPAGNVLARANEPGLAGRRGRAGGIGVLFSALRHPGHVGVDGRSSSGRRRCIDVRHDRVGVDHRRGRWAGRSWLLRGLGHHGNEADHARTALVRPD